MTCITPSPKQSQNEAITMNRRILKTLTIAAVLVFFAFFFFLPVWQVLKGGLRDNEGHFTLFYFKEVFLNPIYLGGLWNSLCIGICTTLLSVAISMPLAWLADRFDFAGKRILTGALLLPMILAPFVGALGMQCIFGRYGAFNALLEALHIVKPGLGPDWFAGGFVAVVVLEALHLFPIMYLNVSAALANVDPQLLEAAADFGCTGFRRFRKIVLPLVMPGVFAGASLVFIWSFTELGTPLMFDYGRCTAVQIYEGLNDLGSNQMPYALVAIVMIFSTGMYALAKFLFGRGGTAMLSKAGRASAQKKLTGWRQAAVIAVFGGIGLFTLLPHLGVLGLAVCKSWYHSILPATPTLEHIQAALGHSLTIPSIINSLRYALLAVLIAIALGIFSAVSIVRDKSRLSWILDTLVMLPLAVPGLVLAFGYLALGQKGEIFYCFDPIQNPTVLLVISYAVRRLPYVVRAAVAGLQQTSVSYEEAAASLGAGPFAVFRRITVPLIMANLIAGGILAFSFSMLEVSDSLILAHKAAYFPITKAIYELSSLLGQGQALASALGLWTMLFLGVSLLTASTILGKKLGALFRV
ncbi:MAG: iron ABC transporter permease [Victivallales bacterium]|nr:iron ABC transporter permease [Victivallales bacterium]